MDQEYTGLRNIYEPPQEAKDEWAAALASGVVLNIKQPYRRLDGSFMYCFKCMKYKTTRSCKPCVAARQKRYQQSDKGKQSQFWANYNRKRREKLEKDWYTNYYKKEAKKAKEEAKNAANTIDGSPATSAQ